MLTKVSPDKFSKTLHRHGIAVSVLPHGGIEEVVIQARPMPGESPAECHIRALDNACTAGGRIYAHEIFAAPELEAEIRTQAEQRFGRIEWPVTYVVDHSGSTCFGGSCIRLVRNTDVLPVTVDSHIVGNSFEDEHARYMYLGNLTGQSLDCSREEQTRSVFEQLLTALNRFEMNFSNVVRTWFYIQDILDWYNVFNKVRTEFFRAHGVFDGLVPASTGIGAANARGSALAAALFAVSAKYSVETSVSAVPSPLQCPALKYGSSFSRAVEVSTADSHRLFISGTASIDPNGKTVHCGDTANQVELTMDVVHAILTSRSMNWDAVRHSIVYLRNAEDRQAFSRYCTQRGLTIPHIQTLNTVCRDDLLFEIEVEAFLSRLFRD